MGTARSRPRRNTRAGSGTGLGGHRQLLGQHPTVVAGEDGRLKARQLDDEKLQSIRQR
jgi:hypothetical protein